jgi:hypothetical protein
MVGVVSPFHRVHTIPHPLGGTSTKAICFIGLDGAQRFVGWVDDQWVGGEFRSGWYDTTGDEVTEVLRGIQTNNPPHSSNNMGFFTDLCVEEMLAVQPTSPTNYSAGDRVRLTTRGAANINDEMEEGDPTVKCSSRPLIFSHSFLNFLRKISGKNKIARIILGRQSDKSKLGPHLLTGEEATYITFRQDGSISYLPMGKEHITTEAGLWSQQNRQTGKAAKVIRKIYTKAGLKLLKPTDFEAFSNDYKAEFALQGYEFKVHANHEIPAIYDADLACDDSGTLGSSCMKGEGDFMEMYAKCPGLRLLGLWDGKLLVGRALIWEANMGGQTITFMDRIYYLEDSMAAAFLQFADDQGWWHKQRYTGREDPMNLVNPAGDKVNNAQLVVKDACPDSFDSWPYIDTFQYSRGDNLYNYKVCDYTACYDSTEGSRTNPLRCAITGEVGDDLITCDRGEFSGQIITNRLAVMVDDEWWWVDDKGICFSAYDHCHYMLEDCVFSDYHDTFILTEDAYLVVGKYYHKDVVEKL